MAANSLRGGKNVYGPHCLQHLGYLGYGGTVVGHPLSINAGGFLGKMGPANNSFLVF